jgi:hypothetical protein
MKILNKNRLMLAALFVLALFSTSGIAEEEMKAALKKDKTGTNPINFQRDLRVYYQYQFLNTAGVGSQNLSTVEFRTPFADGKWQFRMRARYNKVTADVNDDSIDDISESGVGDTDIRFLTVPILDIANKQAWAFGLEVFFDTASEDVLGFKNGLFAPGMQYKFSIDEETGRSKTDQFLIDLNYLLIAGDKQSWFFIDPQIVIDNESSIEFAVVDIEFGMMMSNWFPDLKTQSFYIRPTFGVGQDRPVRGALEFGYKWVGW